MSDQNSNTSNQNTSNQNTNTINQNSNNSSQGSLLSGLGNIVTKNPVTSGPFYAVATQTSSASKSFAETGILSCNNWVNDCSGIHSDSSCGPTGWAWSQHNCSADKRTLANCINICPSVCRIVLDDNTNIAPTSNPFWNNINDGKNNLNTTSDTLNTFRAVKCTYDYDQFLDENVLQKFKDQFIVNPSNIAAFNGSSDFTHNVNTYAQLLTNFCTAPSTSTDNCPQNKPCSNMSSSVICQDLKQFDPNEYNRLINNVICADQTTPEEVTPECQCINANIVMAGELGTKTSALPYECFWRPCQPGSSALIENTEAFNDPRCNVLLCQTIMNLYSGGGISKNDFVNNINCVDKNGKTISNDNGLLPGGKYKGDPNNSTVGNGSNQPYTSKLEAYFSEHSTKIVVGMLIIGVILLIIIIIFFVGRKKNQ